MASSSSPVQGEQTNDSRVHPWHRVNLSITDRRLLRVVEQRLAHQHPDVPAGKIIRMVHGTARLLRAAGQMHQELATQVEAACHQALCQEATGTGSA
jgi:hypothetical protein